MCDGGLREVTTILLLWSQVRTARARWCDSSPFFLGLADKVLDESKATNTVSAGDECDLLGRIAHYRSSMRC